MPAAVGVALALTAVDHVALRAHGVEMTYEVEEVTSRVETDSYYTPDGQMGVLSTLAGAAEQRSRLKWR
nr:hypothetical protein OG409_21025 [Streptomyces sp. NBC_00974]